MNGVITNVKIAAWCVVEGLPSGVNPCEAFVGWDCGIRLVELGINGRVTGVQPGKEFLLGRELPRSPGHAATLFSTYTFNSDQKLLNGLRLGAGATYKSSTWLDTGQKGCSNGHPASDPPTHPHR